MKDAILPGVKAIGVPLIWIALKEGLVPSSKLSDKLEQNFLTKFSLYLEGDTGAISTNPMLEFASLSFSHMQIPRTQGLSSLRQFLTLKVMIQGNLTLINVRDRGLGLRLLGNGEEDCRRWEALVLFIPFPIGLGTTS